MLLWAGALLCFIAYGIQVATEEEPPSDYVSLNSVQFFNLRNLWKKKLLIDKKIYEVKKRNAQHKIRKLAFTLSNSFDLKLIDLRGQNNHWWWYL